MDRAQGSERRLAHADVGAYHDPGSAFRQVSLSVAFLARLAR